MAHDKTHGQTEPTKGQSGNDPSGKPPVETQPGGVTDPNIPAHQVKPVPPGSLPVGQEGAVSLHYIIQADGVSAQVYGRLEGTGGASVNLGVLPCLTVS